MIGIYKITSPTNRIYIGQSINIEKRFSRYKRLGNCNEQKKLYNSFIKHGAENHLFEIVEECKVSELNVKERFYQEFFNCLKNGLNCKLTKTNDRNGEHSEETKLKISIANKGKVPSKEARDKIIKSLIGNKRALGLKHSEETKIIMSKKHLGKKTSEETKIRISESQKGKFVSDITRKKISNFHKNRSDIHKKKIAQSKSVIFLNTSTGVFNYGYKDTVKFENISLYYLQKLVSFEPNVYNNLVKTTP